MVARMECSVNDSARRNIERKRIPCIKIRLRHASIGIQCPPMRTETAQNRSIAACLLLVGLASALTGCLTATGNRPPVATFDASPREGYAPLAVLLDASPSYDADGDNLAYQWTLNGGASAGGRAILHEFPEGTHTVTLAVSDSDGATDTATMTITARSVPDGYVVRNYEWIHDGAPYTWAALLPYNLYQMYRGRLRIPYVDNFDYPAYVLDPLDDPTLEEYATVLWNQAGGDEEAFIERALSFVQGAIAYASDPPNLEWPLYPIETMYDVAGDCEDTTILYVSLLRAKGVPSKIAYVDTDADRTPDHVLALVPVSADHAARLSCGAGGGTTLLTIDGTLHAVAETAVESSTLGLGCDPWDLEGDDVIAWWAL